MIIGFVGLGAMGLPMANNLLKAGHTVRGFDLRPEPLAALASAGGIAAKSAAEAGHDADLLMLMVVNVRQAEAVLFDGSMIEVLPKDAIVVLTATCPPEAVRSLAERVAQTGRMFVDAPVSGGTAGASNGSLSIMAACSGAAYDRVKPVLSAVGGRLFHVGQEPGQGAMVKTVNQLLCGVHIAAAAEALSLAAKMGIDQAVVLQILGGSAATSWMLQDRGPRMLRDEPVVSSAVDIFVKDLEIVLQAGRDSRAALPLAGLAHQLFLATSGRGDGDKDDSQVIRSYALLNGVREA